MRGVGCDQIVVLERFLRVRGNIYVYASFHSKLKAEGWS